MARQKTAEPDPLKPSPQLLIKLGSALVHADEFLGPLGTSVDKTAFDDLLGQRDVKDWIAQMTKLALLPLKRTENRPGVV